MNGCLERALGLRGSHIYFQPDGQFLANVFAGPAFFSIFRYNLSNIDKPGVMFADEDPRRAGEILESTWTLTNRILRLGASDGSLTVFFTSRDGAAKAGVNYVAQDLALIFAPIETEKTIAVPIIDDTRVERDKDFFLRLSSGQNGSTLESEIRIVLLEDDPGVFPTSPTPDVYDPAVSDLVFNARPGEKWWRERSPDLKSWSRDGLSGDIDGSGGIRRAWQDQKAGGFSTQFYRAVKQ